MPSAPIQVHTWPTPNGHKVHIMLEECALPYEAHAVDIGKGEQFAPGFLAISPNNKIPAITDPEGPDGRPISLFESGAILLYLAEKTGRLMPREGKFFTLFEQHAAHIVDGGRALSVRWRRGAGRPRRSRRLGAVADRRLRSRP